MNETRNPATTTTLVLGGGFGGLAAANMLRSVLPPPHLVTVVDQTPRFHVGAGKTWIMLGERTAEQISASRAALLDPGVALIEASVTAIDLAGRTVAIDRAQISWTHLVIALGADVSLAGLPGLAEAAHSFYTVEDAERLRAALERFDGGDVVILIPRVPFKCPPAPYEAAMLLHHWLARHGLSGRSSVAIHTVESAPMPTAGPEMGHAIRQELEQRGIGYFPNRKVARVDRAERRVVFEDGSDARYDLLIAVPPHEAPKVVRDAGLVGPTGWIPVDPLTTRIVNPAGRGQVYAIGDVTSVPLPGRYKPDAPLSLPKAGVFAEAQGRVAARQIAASILDEPLEDTFDGKGFCYLEVGEGRAMRGDGAFFELPHPVMSRRAPDAVQLRDKHEWVASRLSPIRGSA